MRIQQNNKIMIGVVIDNNDPEGLGRVKVKFPHIKEEQIGYWARVCSIMAGAERGVFVLPEIDDEVLIAFELGDISRPFVIGSLWNKQDKPPIKSDEENSVILIKSKSGHTIKIDDGKDKERIEIIDKSEKNSLVIDSSSESIIIKSQNGNIKLEANDIELEAKGNVTIKGSTVNIN